MTLAALRRYGRCGRRFERAVYPEEMLTRTLANVRNRIEIL
jgi:hypothetical protein